MKSTLEDLFLKFMFPKKVTLIDEIFNVDLSNNRGGWNKREGG